MKILQLCNKVPFPSKDGYSIAVFNLSKEFLALNHEVEILAMNTKKHFIQKKYFSQSPVKIITCNANNTLNPIKALWCLLNNKSYNIYRFKSKQFKKKLINILKKKSYDIIQLEGLYLTPYINTIKQYSNAKIILRSHNIEHKIWEDLAENCKSILKKWYLKKLAKQLKKYELAYINRTDAIIAITENDYQFYKKNNYYGKLTFISIGFKETKITKEKYQNTVGFLGSLDWKPNIEGITWFINKVWPKIVSKNPSSILYIAGRKTPSWLKKMESLNVKIIGEIPNANEFIQSKNVIISPLFSGSGIRVKLIEAMFLKKAIVSTSLSAKGINVTHKKEILIANNEDTFSDCVISCLQNNKLNLSLGKHGFNFVKKKYHSHNIAKNFICFYTSIL